MSADDPGQREVAYRLFAAEYDDANYSYSESDEERAPNYVVTPTGARVNRVFVVGVLTEVGPVNENMLRGRVADPTGAFVLYAGQYEPDEQAVLERTDPPAFVAVTGKANTFEPEDGDTVYTSIRPESINVVDAETRDRWTVQAAEQTLTRVHHAATALSTGLSGDRLREALHKRDIDPVLVDGIVRALAHYRTTPRYLQAVRGLALDAARVVASQRDGARELTVAPDDPGDVTAEDLLATTPAPGRQPEDSAESDTGAQPGTGASTDAGTRVEASSDEPAQTAAEPATGHGSERGPADQAAGGTTDERTDTAADASGGTADRVSGTGTAEEPETTERVDTAGEPEFAADIDTGESGETGTNGTSTASDETEEPTTAVGDPGEFDEEFDLSAEVREEVEEEFGTEFQSGTEVDEPGEADIPTEGTEQPPEGTSEGVTASNGSAGTASGAPSEPGGEDTERSASAPPVDEDGGPTGGSQAGDEGEERHGATEDIGSGGTEVSADTGSGGESSEADGVEDPQAAVLAVMEELDDGNGADREAVVSEVRERHGLTAAAVDEAVQSALMDGQCYEPGDGLLKPI